jgi:transposase
MQLKTILNQVTDYKSFVFKKTEMITESDKKEILATIEPRKNSMPVCSHCGEKCSIYDTQDTRRFEFVPLFAIPVIFLYAMRRANCPDHGPTIERVPWCEGKNRSTKEYRCFLATWAKRMSWTEVARCFNTSYDTVFRSVQKQVEIGLELRSLDGIASIGVDEVQYRKGQNYLTLVFQICKGSRR